MPRLFFAIWPDPAAAEKLGRLAGDLGERCGGRALPRGKIHLTLAFLGEVPADRADDLVRAADRVKQAPFDLALDRIGAFRRARVAWVGTDAPPEPLLAVESTLRQALRERGFELEERPYKPHVTLARKIASVAAAAIEPIAWRVEEFALVRSDMGTGTYTTVATWPLKAGRKRK